MNEFLFWCRHPLVPLLFYEVTSLHPPSFQRNDFSTCNKDVASRHLRTINSTLFRFRLRSNKYVWVVVT